MLGMKRRNCQQVLYPHDTLNVDAQYALVMDIYDGKRRAWLDRQALEFRGQRCPAMSFSFPLKTSRGRLLFPACRQVRDPDGKAVHYRDCWAPVDEMVTVIGEYDASGKIAWHLGQPRALRRKQTPHTSAGQGDGAAARSASEQY